MVEGQRVFRIKGLDCADCASELEKVISRLDGVRSAEVSVATARLEVTREPGTELEWERVEKTIASLGYSLENDESTSTVTLNVEGMDCQDEAGLIEKKLKSLPGVLEFDIYLMTESLRVSYSPALQSASDLIKAIAETGMRASLAREKRERKVSWWRERRQGLSLCLCGFLVAVGFVLELFHVPGIGARIAFGLAIASGIYYPAKMGLLALKNLTLNIRLLMVIGAAGAIALGLWEEAALLVFVYSLGDVLEAYAMDRARGAIKALVDLLPREALVLRNGDEIVLPTAEIDVGDTIIVRPGEYIPLDGVVISGRSYVDQSAITGEPMPAEIQAGNEVFAGTVNQRGALEVNVTKKSTDTTLARIIYSVEEAQAKKSSYQRFGERFGKYYTPLMALLGAGVAIIPPLLGASWSQSIYRGLVVIVVSCSCGLALSVPVSVVSATAKAARSGVLFKGGAYLEVAREVKAVVFDKTGTLTIGRPSVTDVIALDSVPEAGLLSLAGAIESRSEHPLAEAIVRKAKENGASLENGLEEFEALPGFGARAGVKGETFYAGNTRLFESRGIETGPSSGLAAGLEEDGKTVVMIGDERRVMGIIAVADILRPEAAESVSMLKKMGLATIMLTGDNQGTARAIASRAGIDEYEAQLLPEDKVAAVERIREKYGKVAMVGDGINDAPAMAASDLGIAMGAAGTAIARETGDVVLGSDDLRKVAYALRVSGRTVRNIRMNVIASLLIVAFLVPAALAGLITLVPGLLLNEGSALLVIFNALRLQR